MNEDLKDAFFERDQSCFADSPDFSREKRRRAVLSRTAPFVAMVDSQGEITRLVDREALLEKVAESLVNEWSEE